MLNVPEDPSVVGHPPSPSFNAGYSVMESLVEDQTASNSTNSGAVEDLLMKNRMLMSKSHNDRLSLQKVEEELRFARHKYSEREKKLEAEKAAAKRATDRVTAMEGRMVELESVNATLKAQLGDARQKIADLHAQNLALTKNNPSAAAFASSPSLTTSVDSARPRSNSGASRFAEMHRDKVKIIRLQRALRELREERQRAMCAMENSRMEAEDTFMQNPIVIQSLLEEAEAKQGYGIDDGATRPKRNMITFDALRRGGRANALGFSEEKLDLKMPEDRYIDAKIGHSSFDSPISTMRGDLSNLAHEWSEFMDTTLSSLWMIFQEQEKKGKSVLANPRDDFMKEVKRTLTKTRSMLFGMMKSVNHNVKEVLNSEKAVKIKWIKEAHPSNDFSVQVDIPPPEDPRIAELGGQVDYLKNRIDDINTSHAKSMTEMELAKDKAEVNCQYLQSKVFELHESVYEALHTVYKHRFHWTARLPNNFATVDKSASKKKVLEVKYNVELARAIDEDVKLMQQFRSYFLSDDLFGVDLSGAKAMQQQDKDVVPKKKEAVPTKHKKVDTAKRLSVEVNSMLRRESSSMLVEPEQMRSDSCNSNVSLGEDCTATTTSPQLSSGRSTPTPPLPRIGDEAPRPKATSSAPKSTAARRSSAQLASLVSPTLLPQSAARPPKTPQNEAGKPALKRQNSFTTNSNNNGTKPGSASQTSSASRVKALNFAGLMPFGEDSSESLSAPTTPTGHDALERMETWQKMQHAQWEQKRQLHKQHAEQQAFCTVQLDPELQFGPGEDPQATRTFAMQDRLASSQGGRRPSVKSARRASTGCI